VERSEKRRVVIYEEEQNKDNVKEYERKLPASIAPPVIPMYQG
jgi:hypothetical protein